MHGCGSLLLKPIPRSRPTSTGAGITSAAALARWVTGRCPAVGLDEIVELFSGGRESIDLRKESEEVIG